MPTPAAITALTPSRGPMKLHILTTFLDGRDRFEAGDIRTVPDADGQRFIGNGWARRADDEQLPAAAAPAGDVGLSIHGAVIGTGDSNG